MSKVINGSDLMLFINGNSIAFATSHSLSLSAETVETSSKDNGGKWTSKSVRKLSWNTNTENLYSTEGEGTVFSELFNLWTAGTEIDVIFALSSDSSESVPEEGWTPSTTGQYKGKVVITSLELNAPNGDNATFSASFEGVGAITAV